MGTLVVPIWCWKPRKSLESRWTLTHHESWEVLVLLSAMESVVAATPWARGKALLAWAATWKGCRSQGGLPHIDQDNQSTPSGEAPCSGDSNLWQVDVKTHHKTVHHWGIQEFKQEQRQKPGKNDSYWLGPSGLLISQLSFLLDILFNIHACIKCVWIWTLSSLPPVPSLPYPTGPLTFPSVPPYFPHFLSISPIPLTFSQGAPYPLLACLTSHTLFIANNFQTFCCVQSADFLFQSKHVETWVPAWQC